MIRYGDPLFWRMIRWYFTSQFDRVNSGWTLIGRFFLLSFSIDWRYPDYFNPMLVTGLRFSFWPTFPDMGGLAFRWNWWYKAKREYV